MEMLVLVFAIIVVVAIHVYAIVCIVRDNKMSKASAIAMSAIAFVIGLLTGLMID